MCYWPYTVMFIYTQLYFDNQVSFLPVFYTMFKCRYKRIYVQKKVCFVTYIEVLMEVSSFYIIICYDY